MARALTGRHVLLGLLELRRRHLRRDLQPVGNLKFLDDGIGAFIRVNLVNKAIAMEPAHWVRSQHRDQLLAMWRLLLCDIIEIEPWFLVLSRLDLCNAIEAGLIEALVDDHARDVFEFLLRMKQSVMRGDPHIRHIAAKLFPVGAAVTECTTLLLFFLPAAPPELRCKEVRRLDIIFLRPWPESFATSGDDRLSACDRHVDLWQVQAERHLLILWQVRVPRNAPVPLLAPINHPCG